MAEPEHMVESEQGTTSQDLHFEIIDEAFGLFR